MQFTTQDKIVILVSLEHFQEVWKIQNLLLDSYISVVYRQIGAATKLILIIRVFRRQLLFLSVAGDAESLEESSECSKWFKILFKIFLYLSFLFNSMKVYDVVVMYKEL